MLFFDPWVQKFLYIQKRYFLHKKIKNVLAKIVKRRENIFRDPQMFSGDELDIKGR